MTAGQPDVETTEVTGGAGYGVAADDVQDLGRLAREALDADRPTLIHHCVD